MIHQTSAFSPIGCARDYAELRHLLNERRKELRMTQLDVDVGSRNFGPKSLGAILAALGVELLLPIRPGIEKDGR